MKEKLQHYISRYIQLDDSDFEHFYSLLQVDQFSKKEFLLEEGKISRNQFFILEGLVRTFYTDHNGNEKVIQFGIENWWVTDMDSFINQQVSMVTIQALEKTKVLSISKTKLDQAFLEIPKLERLFRIITEKSLVAQQRKSHFFMKASSKERYLGLIKAIPNFVQRVPQYMIASYLDITPEYLSDLRKKH